MSLEIVSAIIGADIPSALVTVISVKGSAPRHPGSKMFVRADGSFIGTVGGGTGESSAIAAARAAIDGKCSSILRVEMLGVETEGSAMICGGVNTMLIEYIDSTEPYRVARSILRSGRRAVFAKTFGDAVSSGPVDVRVSVLDRSDGSLAQSAAFSRGKAAFVESGSSSVFLDPIFPEERLLILGGGHVGKAIADFAVPLGFSVTVADDRAEFASPDRFAPEVRTIAGSYTETIAAFPFDPATYAIVVTRGHLYDLECSRALMKRDYRYAGVIGSSRKIGMIMDQLASDGCPAAKVASLRAPIGLDIAAETPHEIAAAIAAELVAVRRDAPMLAALEIERLSRRGGTFGALR